MSTKRLLPDLVIGLALIAVVLSAGETTVLGQRPRASGLLPKNTVAYLRIEDAPEFAEQLRSTAMGRMIDDPQVQPFVNHLYESATEAFRGVSGELGFSLDQLLSVPDGEICLAFVAPQEGPPAVVVLVESQQQTADARRIMEHLQQDRENRGDQRSTERVGDTTLTVLKRRGDPNRQTVFFERGGTFVVTSDVALAKQMLPVWSGSDVPTLADNEAFTTIMDRCDGSSGERPQLTYFVNPLALANSFASQNMVLELGLAALEPLNLKGLRGVGGSLILGGSQFESQHHMHILIDSPRTGALEILALRTGDVAPETWVPGDVASYLTLHWDPEKSYSAMGKVYDHFRGPDAWAKATNDSIGASFGVSVEKDLLAGMEGRVTRITAVEQRPERAVMVTLFGVKLKNAKTFRATLDKAIAGARDRFTDRTFMRSSYHYFSPRGGSRDAQGIAKNLGDSYLVLLGDYLLLSDSEELLKRAIATKNGTRPALGEELDYKLNASKIKRLTTGAKPSLVLFERPEIALRASYELMRSDDTIRRLAPIADRNKLFQSLHDAMRQHPLPPFAALEKYFAFSGRVVTSDDSGIHSLGFTFRRD